MTTMIGKEIKPFVAQSFKPTEAGKGEFVKVTDGDVRGNWAVFFFYPADFTFVCPTELEDLADHYDALKGMGVDVDSVSTDTKCSIKAGHESSENIGKSRFHMLGDQTHSISNNFEGLREGQGLADRATFVVETDGIIQLMEITSEGVGRNAAELVRKIKAAQYVRANPGQVCPAKWEEGEATLAPSLDLVGKL